LLAGFQNTDTTQEKIKTILTKEAYQLSKQQGYRVESLTIDSIHYKMVGIGAWYRNASSQIKPKLQYFKTLRQKQGSSADTRIIDTNIVIGTRFSMFTDSLALAADQGSGQVYRVDYRIKIKSNQSLINNHAFVFMYPNTLQIVEINIDSLYKIAHP
jgi:hypothetical protein